MASDTSGGFYAVWLRECGPRLLTAGIGVSLVTIDRTIPQVVATSGGRLPTMPFLTRARMCGLFIPKQGVLKTGQFVAMREVKLSLDQYLPSSLSTMLAYGLTGVPFQSVIYNTLISDTYKFHTGQAAGVNLREMARGVMPGIVWCFIRECCATGGGLYFGPILKQKVVSELEERGKAMPPELALRFSSGLVCGAFCALGTQWLHNATLTAGRMAAVGDTKGAPHYTMSSMRGAYAELGGKMFYLNYPQRMMVIAGASAMLNLLDIFHRPDLRFI